MLVINTEIQTPFANIESKTLSVFHHNVCSLSKNFDQLYAFLTKLDIDFDFIGITESRNSNINFSPISIALENDTIKQVPTKSNHTVTDPQATANAFNSFFCLVATEVESEVSFSYKTFFEYLPPLNHESFFISPCTKAELIEIF